MTSRTRRFALSPLTGSARPRWCRAFPIVLLGLLSVLWPSHELRTSEPSGLSILGLENGQTIRDPQRLVNGLVSDPRLKVLVVSGWSVAEARVSPDGSWITEKPLTIEAGPDRRIVAYAFGEERRARAEVRVTCSPDGYEADGDLRLTLDTATCGSVTTQFPYSIQGSVSDPDSRVSVQGPKDTIVSVEAGPDGRFNLPLELDPGVNVISLLARDSRGREVRARRWLTYAGERRREKPEETDSKISSQSAREVGARSSGGATALNTISTSDLCPRSELVVSESTDGCTEVTKVTGETVEVFLIDNTRVEDATILIDGLWRSREAV